MSYTKGPAALPDCLQRLLIKETIQSGLYRRNETHWLLQRKDTNYGHCFKPARSVYIHLQTFADPQSAPVWVQSLVLMMPTEGQLGSVFKCTVVLRKRSFSANSICLHLNDSLFKFNLIMEDTVNQENNWQQILAAFTFTTASECPCGKHIKEEPRLN